MGSQYEKSGVNISAGEKAVKLIKQSVASTYSDKVLKGLGSFAGFYELENGQVLVAATDGVGTKLDIAIEVGIHNTVGIDLVAMSVNDILVHGAKPLFFLDYIASSKLDPNQIAQIVDGVADGCRQSGCALLGGETAEMPGFYPEGKYDLAGCAVGIVQKDKIIDGSSIKQGMNIIGVASSGFHSNGFSLVRKVIKDNSLKLDKDYTGQLLGQELLIPTKIYAKPVMALIEQINIAGLVHITGGGFIHNIPRVLPDGCGVEINKGTWDIAPIFSFIQDKGEISEDEMFEVFNMGIGLVIILEQSKTKQALDIISQKGYQGWVIGEVTSGEGTVELR
ncbi:MAG: phosphoribosylformylglycinamidine cyclo-ligase [Actinobacteria bacterium]|nr:MAG: phosphoribosylformylglycinamidine cyclo-ligase [Actinomycetota bacterium]